MRVTEPTPTRHSEAHGGVWKCMGVHRRRFWPESLCRSSVLLNLPSVYAFSHNIITRLLSRPPWPLSNPTMSDHGFSSHMRKRIQHVRSYCLRSSRRKPGGSSQAKPEYPRDAWPGQLICSVRCPWRSYLFLCAWSLDHQRWVSTPGDRYLGVIGSRVWVIPLPSTQRKASHIPSKPPLNNGKMTGRSTPIWPSRSKAGSSFQGGSECL